MHFMDVKLKTAELVPLKLFYEKTLQVPVIDEGDGFFSLRIGETRLTFEETEEGQPFYHYAFNIPENQFKEAKAWLADKVTLNQHEGEDEADFVSWNAHAVYFEDPAGNIVELIARHNLDNASDEPFSASSLLCVSEIGIVRNEVPSFVEELVGQGLSKWREGSEEFVPVGDEHGLLIVVKKDRRWFFAEKDAGIFPVSLNVKGHGILEFR
ncbi:ring-cleaving dioxygenase [Paenibacillus sp. KQZ6P-2]|uniref:Ring-cleaving dioxygenase n=1 Tax=Paenibacillus mangrovi TaxID=2931978 RepID=A0A9X2B523_9BACL|nr:ring-cleaving dioxygenase [Paenibacillus mangrovi]MCJ8011583.1 ring-cleaving dioxygenase [Paenibacillus mangrovi]